MSGRASSSRSQSWTNRYRSVSKPRGVARAVGRQIERAAVRVAVHEPRALAADERAARHPLGELAIEADERLFAFVAPQERELVPQPVQRIHARLVFELALGGLSCGSCPWRCRRAAADSRAANLRAPSPGRKSPSR